jgi:zinc carboxypeptidase
LTLLVMFSGLSAETNSVRDPLVYTPAMTEAHTKLVSRSPYVTPTLSCNASLALNAKGPLAKFVVGVSAGHASDPFIPRHNLYAYKITDPAAKGPKKTVLIQTGNHNTEATASWSFQGMVDFLLSSDPRAGWLRRHGEFYVYPLVNPDGRFIAKGRGNPEMLERGILSGSGKLDHNRVWNRQWQGLSTIDALTAAMRKDTGRKVDYYFDFHDGSEIKIPFFYTVPDLMDSPYGRAMIALDVEIAPKASNGDPGMGRIWSMTTEGLNSKFACTPEGAPQYPGLSVDMCLGWGRNYAIALFNTLNAPVAEKEPAATAVH